MSRERMQLRRMGTSAVAKWLRRPRYLISPMSPYVLPKSGSLKVLAIDFDFWRNWKKLELRFTVLLSYKLSLWHIALIGMVLSHPLFLRWLLVDNARRAKKKIFLLTLNVWFLVNTAFSMRIDAPRTIFVHTRVARLCWALPKPIALTQCP